MADYRIRIFVDPSGAVAGSRTATRAVESVGRAVDNVREKSVPGLMDQFRSMGGALKLAAIVAGVGAYARLSDGIATANGQLRLATKTQAQLNQAQRESYAIAQKQGSSYNSLATLYAKATKAATGMGNEMDRAMKLGEATAAAIAAGIKVSGTGAGAAAAGVFQLSQALASGTLRGDELNSVMENIPAVGDAIAKAMGRSAGELRKMGAAGQLTSKAVIEGLEKARPELERLADLIPLTFGQAFQKVQNAAGKLLTGIDKGGIGFGSAMISSINLLSKGLDGLADNASTVSNIVVGLLVSAALKSAAAAVAAGVATRQQAAANLALAQSSVVAAAAQHQQAIASLAVARANSSLGGAGAGAAAAQVAASARALAGARTAATAAGAALEGAKASAGLFGRALVGAASMGRAALALVGGPIGVIVAALVALGLYAAKAALSFQPIAGEAATVGDYIMEAFSKVGEWVGKVAKGIWQSIKDAFSSMTKFVRPVIVWFIDAWLSVGRAVAGVAMGIVEAFKEAFSQVGKMIAALSADAQNIFSGNWGAVGASVKVATSAPGAVGGAFSRGYGNGSRVGGGVTGESAVKALEALPGRIGEAIMNSDTVQKLRKGANERARMRAAGGEGGAQEPGTSSAAAEKGDKAAKEKKAAEDKKKSFEDIIKLAQEETRLAGMTTSEQEVQNALISARRDLERELTTSEADRLTSEIRRRQTVSANLALDQQILQVTQDTASARLSSAAEEARMSKDYGRAAQLESELKVQEALNQAKKDGVELDAKKVEAYRQATLYAAQESEIIRLQAEAKRALQEIADNARKAMQSAVSDGIYAALSGDIKGVKGLFSTIGNILKRQIAESLTSKIFGDSTGAAVDSLKATQAAVNIVTPATQAVTVATNNIVSALNQGAASIANAANDNLAAPIAAAGDTLQQQVPDLKAGTEGWVAALSSTLGPLGSAIGSLISAIGSIFSKKGSGGAGGAAGRAIGGAGSFGAKLSSGAQTGAIIGAVGSMISSKFSQTGATIGGAIGSFIPIPGGKIIGSIIGGIIGGMLKKTKSGGASIGSSGITGTAGNNKGMIGEASGYANTVSGSLGRIADALGTTLGNFSVAIGKRSSGWIKVSASGNAAATTGKKVTSDIIYNGKDENEAIRVAILNALQDGAITGIREGTKRLLQAGKDLDAAVQKAVSFESVFKRLKQYKDPVGAAVEAIDKEFMNLKKIFLEAGASAAEYADLEELYGLERAKAIKDATKSTTDALSQFIAELRGGSLGGASLSSQAAEQNRLFTAIEDAQKAGKTVDYDQLNTVGRALIEATRELEGATPAFYDQVNRVMTVLEAAIASGSNPTVSTLPAPLVFRDEVTTPLIGSIGSLQGVTASGFAALLAAMNDQSQAIVRGNSLLYDALGSGSSNGGIDTRAFRFSGF